MDPNQFNINPFFNYMHNPNFPNPPPLPNPQNIPNMNNQHQLPMFHSPPSFPTLPFPYQYPMFQSPPTNPSMDHGNSIGTSGGQSCEQEQDVASEFATESQTPPFSTQTGLDNIALDEEEKETEEELAPKRAGWAPEEDALLVQSWLNVSKDAVVGVNQKANSFWSRIKNRYNEYRGHLQAREVNPLKCRWQKLNAIVQKFAGCYNKASERKRSGSSEADILRDAYMIYSEQGARFKLEYAWRLLKEEPKWSSTLVAGENKRTKKSDSGTYSSSSNPGTPSSFEYNPTSPTVDRPMGTKAAKRKAKLKENETSSAHVDLTTMEETQKSKISAIEDLARAKHERNKLKEEALKIKDKELEYQWKMKDKELEYQLKMKDKELELQSKKEKKFELEILFKDTSSMTERQLRDHEKLCNIIRQKYGLDSNLS